MFLLDMPIGPRVTTTYVPPVDGDIEEGARNSAKARRIQRTAAALMLDKLAGGILAAGV